MIETGTTKAIRSTKKTTGEKTMITFIRVENHVSIDGKPYQTFNPCYTLPNMKIDDAIMLIEQHLKKIGSDAFLVPFGNDKILIKINEVKPMLSSIDE